MHACPLRAADHAHTPCTQVPIMLRSLFCSLNEHTDKELTELGEDPYDSVRHVCIDSCVVRQEASTACTARVRAPFSHVMRQHQSCPTVRLRLVAVGARV